MESCHNTLAAFNPSSIGYAVSLGREVYKPNRTPRLKKVIEEYGEIFLETFLSIQIADNFKNLGVNCYDIERATENICIAVKSECVGYNLMLAEWLLVFHKMNNCEDVRRDYNQANYVRCLKDKVKEVANERDKEQSKMRRGEFEKEKSLLKEQKEKGEISKEEYIKGIEKAQYNYDNYYEY